MSRKSRTKNITRGISLPLRVERMALESARRYGVSFSAYIRSLVIRDNYQKP